MIEEIPNNNIKLEIPSFLCDYQLTKRDIKPLPNTHHFMVFTGPPGSGKTSLSIGLLTTKGKNKIYKNVFHNVILVCPSNSRKSIKNDPFSDLAEEKVFYELNSENLETIHDMVKLYSDDEENTLLYIDDCAASLKNGENQNILKMLIQNRRHLRLSIWIISQTYNLIPLNIRKLINILVMFKPTNKKEYLSVFEEIMFYDKNNANEIFNYTYKKRHDFLLLNTDTQHIYKKFNQLKIISND